MCQNLEEAEMANERQKPKNLGEKGAIPKPTLTLAAMERLLQKIARAWAYR